jgi:hypothetical protein
VNIIVTDSSDDVLLPHDDVEKLKSEAVTWKFHNILNPKEKN